MQAQQQRIVVQASDLLFEGLDPEVAAPFLSLPWAEQVKIAYTLERAGRAREDVVEFFEFVVREETERTPLSIRAHQRLFFEFVQKHRRVVVRMPRAFSKTYLLSTFYLWELGREPTRRGIVISATAEQARKPLGMVRAIIENSDELRLVFPNLRPTRRDHEPWTTSQIVVDRPYGIRDASLSAVGWDSERIQGSRISHIYGDDLVNAENCASRELREAMQSRLKSTVLSRQDIGARTLITNTPFDPEDITYWLETELHFPSLTMDAFGDVHIKNAPDFDTPLIRPVYEVAEIDPTLGQEEAQKELEKLPLRLVANDDRALIAQARSELGRDPVDRDVDTDGDVPLWPQKYSHAALAVLREDFDTEVEWNQVMRCRARSDSSDRVKDAWITACKELAREKKHLRVVDKWDRGRTFTGVDLAVGKNKKSDWTALFTIYVDEDGLIYPLDADFGRWAGKVIVDKVAEKHDRYGSIIRMETNAAQDFMRQWSLEFDKQLPIQSHNTGKNKRDPHFGLESIFIGLENRAWVIPPEKDRGIAQWLDEVKNYDPDKHPGDLLMASWIAREQARASGVFVAARKRRRGGDLGARRPFAGVLSR